MPELVIKPYDDTQHADGLRALLMPILRDEHGYDVTFKDMPDLQDIAGTYRIGIGECWVVVHGKQVVGVMSILDLDHHQVSLRKFFVKKAFRRPAYDTAKLMLDHLTAYANSVNLQEILLGTTPAFVSGHRFYEKSGFARIDRTDLPAKFPISAVHTRFYCLKITA